VISSNHDTTETYCCLLTAGDASGEARHIPRHEVHLNRKQPIFFLPTSPRTEPRVELTRTLCEPRNYIAFCCVTDTALCQKSSDVFRSTSARRGESRRSYHLTHDARRGIVRPRKSRRRRWRPSSALDLAWQHCRLPLGHVHEIAHRRDDARITRASRVWAARWPTGCVLPCAVRGNTNGASAWILRTRRQKAPRFSSYWETLPPVSCPIACHSFQYFQPPQSQYRLLTEGTLYVLREKVRFFDPFRYAASCVELHEER
jgi:hypothetical protein